MNWYRNIGIETEADAADTGAGIEAGVDAGMANMSRVGSDRWNGTGSLGSKLRL